MTALPPVLARGGSWTWSDCTWTFELGDTWDATDVSNVMVVPFVGDRVVLIRTPGEYSAVGGTLEPGEHWANAATRELMEEAGAALLDTSEDRPVLHPFGAYLCHTARPAPYRPHLPWPDYKRVVSWAEVQVVAAPTMPDGGEVIEEVLLLDVEEACALLETNSPADAALYRLAAQLRARGVDDAT